MEAKLDNRDMEAKQEELLGQSMTATGITITYTYGANLLTPFGQVSSNRPGKKLWSMTHPIRLCLECVALIDPSRATPHVQPIARPAMGKLSLLPLCHIDFRDVGLANRQVWCLKMFSRMVLVQL